MADVIDVQNTLVAAIAAAVYPNGTAQPSVSGSAIIAYAGWPTASKLDDDLLHGKSHITVFPTATESNKTRYPTDWQQQSINTASITAALSAQAITIGGAMPSPFVAHNVVALVNAGVYVYSAQQNDTLASIAAGLAALIAVDVPGTTSAGPVVTMPTSANVKAARIGVTGTSIREIRRQERVFQITVWADTPAKRDAIGQALDIALAKTEYLTMPDGFGARIIYRSSPVLDNLQKAKLYRRDFMYSVEFATTERRTDMQITQVQLGVALQNDGATSAAPDQTFIS